MRAHWIALLGIAMACFGCAAGSDGGEEEESSVDRTEDFTTLTCASLEQRLVGAAQRISAQAAVGCSSTQSQTAYENAMMDYFVAREAMAANRCCTSGRCMSKPLATAIANVTDAAKGACMQHACLTRGQQGTPLAGAIRQLDCDTKAEVAEFLSKEDALTAVCQDPPIRTSATALRKPEPTALIIEFGASLRTAYCGKTLTVCSTDNADCRSAIRCRDYLEHEVPYVEGHLQDVVDANCAGPAQLSAHHKVSNTYENYTAPTLASCAPYFTPDEAAQVAEFTALAHNADLVCEKSQGCLDALAGLESLIDSKLMPIATASCAGQSLIDQQAQLQTQVNAFKAELSTCAPYMIEPDNLRYTAASAEAAEVDQVCSASADCREQLDEARTSASTIATIKSHGCPDADEDAYHQAKSDFSANFIDGNHSCMAHMTAADKQELTSLQSQVAANACVFCGIEGRHCCKTGDDCVSGTMCGGADNNTCVPCGKSGIACCPGSAEDRCGNGLKCSSNICQSCGQKNLDCCDTSPACFQMAPDNTSCQNGKCKSCGHVEGGACCADSPKCYDGMTCENSKCVHKLPAGEVGGECLSGNVCKINSWARCNTGTGKCESCGATNSWCCGESSSINKCTPENSCNPNTDRCYKCGALDEPCCNTNGVKSCPNGGVKCDEVANKCVKL